MSTKDNNSFCWNKSESNLFPEYLSQGHIFISNVCVVASQVHRKSSPQNSYTQFSN